MNKPSRRGFLAAAGAGAAAVGAASVAPKAAAARPDAGEPAVPRSGHTEPLVAYVRDAHTGEVAVMVGEQEVVVHDPELAARIARVARSLPAS
jgi:hypothetical protein